MSRIPIREIEDDYDDEEYEDKRRDKRSHNKEKKVEKKKSWDRETIFDHYDDDERR